jgi:hypothetical protein
MTCPEGAATAARLGSQGGRLIGSEEVPLAYDAVPAGQTVEGAPFQMQD